ncbi:hypothetical protein F5B21DRAFT_493817 [Xylaria acuta]|nr:hypothetical protein F5B21DRAFT_493817 [Xylaria acuta]
MSMPLGIGAISSLGCRIGSRRPQCLNFPRNIVTTTSSVETPQAVRVAFSAAEPARQPYQNPKPRRRKRRVPRLCPFNAYRATPYKLVKTYTGKLSRGHPMLIRNLPGFLDGQSWIDHVADREGSFNTPQTSRRKHSEPGFDVLKAILASAVTGRTQGNLNPDSESAKLRTVFDDFEAECKISRTVLEGDYPPLLMFGDWLRQSQFRDYSLGKTIAELRAMHHTTPQQWIPIKAPLVFFRAVHQYNRDQRKATGTVSRPEGSTAHDQYHPACIDGLNGLVVLNEALTEEFPFPRIIRDIGQSTYKTKSCSIRVGVRPLRSDVRRYKHSTVVVGQLAGYSVVTLIPPRVNSLNGLPLEFHGRVPQTWERSTLRFPLGLSNLSLSSKTWTRDFEDELSASGDILVATLIPGDGLLVPEGWWYGVRSINNGLQLHATVTWFLGRDELPVGDQEEYEKGKYLKGHARWVEI